MNYEFPIKAYTYEEVSLKKKKILNAAKEDGFIIYELVAKICDPGAKIDDLPLSTRGELKWTYEDLTRPRGMWLNNKDLPNKSLWLMEPESKKDSNKYYADWNQNQNYSQNSDKDKKEDTRRPCLVKFGKKTWKKGYFHQWVANTFPTEGFLISNMLALVELEDGSVVQKEPKCIIFVDGGGFGKWEDKR